MTTRQLRQTIRSLLANPAGFERALAEIRQFPSSQAVNPLFALFLDKEELVRWRAVSAMGVVVAHMADTTGMEPARVVMRRLMWSLNDESGGIGWGAPEAMGDIMARHERLADEYQHMLMSYLNPEGNHIEHPVLQRGVLWGVGRLAESRPEAVREALFHLYSFLTSSDPHHRGLAAWAALRIEKELPAPFYRQLSLDMATFRFYKDGSITTMPVSRILTV